MNIVMEMKKMKEGRKGTINNQHTEKQSLVYGRLWIKCVEMMFLDNILYRSVLSFS